MIFRSLCVTGKVEQEEMHTGWFLSRRSLDVFRQPLRLCQPGDHPPNLSLGLHRVNLPPPQQVRALYESTDNHSRFPPETGHPSFRHHYIPLSGQFQLTEVPFGCRPLG